MSENLTPTEASALAVKIIQGLPYAGLKSPSKGQFVVTGPQQGRADPLFRIGYCVQVRKGAGAYCSDMVFLRHPDGRLTTHENQFFSGMTAEQEELARTLFKVLPEDEEYEKGFNCTDGVHEVGFLIEHSASQPSPNTQTVIVTVTAPDGRKEATAFI